MSLISKQVDELRAYAKDRKGELSKLINDAADTIERLSAKVREPKWIPCSERLPEEEYVLISKKPTKLSGSKWCVTIAIRMEDPRSRKVNWRDIGFGIIPDDNVLAWKPCPEPYREEGE